MLAGGKLPFEADNMPEARPPIPTPSPRAPPPPHGSGRRLQPQVSRLQPDASPLLQVFRMIKEEEPTVPPHASAALQQLLRRMLAKRPEQRPSLQELRIDPWVTASGTHPLPYQDCGEMVPTETEIHDAIKELGVSIKVVVAAKKWRSAALKSHAAVSFMHAAADAAAKDDAARDEVVAKQAGAEAEQAVAANAFANAGIAARGRAAAGAAGDDTPVASAPDEAI